MGISCLSNSRAPKTIGSGTGGAGEWPRSSVRPDLPCGDGGTRLVEIEECAVEAVLVEVAAGHLDPSGVGDTTRFQRLEAGGTDQSFDRRRSLVVVGGVEEHGPLRLAG